MNISINGESRELDGLITLTQLLDQLELKSRQVAVEVNLELIPRDKHSEYELQPGDKLEIVTLAGGG